MMPAARLMGEGAGLFVRLAGKAAPPEGDGGGSAGHLPGRRETIGGKLAKPMCGPWLGFDALACAWARLERRRASLDGAFEAVGDESRTRADGVARSLPAGAVGVAGRRKATLSWCKVRDQTWPVPRPGLAGGWSTSSAGLTLGGELQARNSFR